MERQYDVLLKTIFRLRGLPPRIKTLDDVARLTSTSLGDIPTQSVRVFSLATNLSYGDSSPSKVATVMFSTIPSLVRNNKNKDTWEIPIQKPEPGNHLLLDVHFEGMTAMNDVDSLSHKYDCIAISGLASHPFGSWQPKASDKTFMWIRDALPKHIHGIRTVLYGYETRLAGSQSIEHVMDLASKLIALLIAYGWGSQSSKPVIFLAHSLGGLVLRDALRQLADARSKKYTMLLNSFRGALLFGVPNLGIEQGSFLDIAQGNPNETLIEDIGRGSNYLRRLNERFSHDPVNGDFKQFWAYETLESPTITRASDGSLDRNGPLAILVSRDSATLRIIQQDPSATFPIKATHSDMVKFTRESPDYHVVVSKISSIVNDETDDGENYTAHQADAPERSGAIGKNMTVQLESFKRLTAVTTAEEIKFLSVTFVTIQEIAREIQVAQEEKRSLMYMQRLEPFMLSLQQFSKILEATGITFGLNNPMAYIWGPMEYILRATASHSNILNCILDAYQEVGEQIPQLHAYKERFAASQHLNHALVLIYNDVLWFHAEILQQLKQREWKMLFKSTWGDFAACLEQIKENIARSHRLIDGNVSFKELEEIHEIRSSSLRTFRANKSAQNISRRSIIFQWLSSDKFEAKQAEYRKIRSVCKSPGAWLLNNSQFLNWSAPEFCSDPILWLNGIPGAGKTILASIVVDHLQLLSGAAVVYFYCKHGDEARGSFIAVARAILTQLLLQRPHLTSYFFEKASSSGQVLLDSTTTAKEMIQTALSTCDKTYIIIDGVDECERNHRDEIVGVFRMAIQDLPADSVGSVRCLFVSQDDGNARRNFRNIPAIKITNQNHDDIRDFAEKRHLALEIKFGQLRTKECYISKILVARAQGMFIFADLFAKYLESQLTKAALLEELNPSKLPVTLDHVYERILKRIFESRDDTSVKASIRRILGWITCARRPLKWTEVQGAVCVDMEKQTLNYDRKLSDSPDSLFASLVSIREDTVELVHETARHYLLKHIIDFHEANYSLAMVSIGYLSLPQIDMKEQTVDEEVYSYLINGIYAFYDYASACWAMHLQDGILELKAGSELAQLLEALEVFIELHWSPTHKPLHDLKRTRISLDSAKISESFEKIVYAVGWAKRQSGRCGHGPSPDEALDLWQVTNRTRSILEASHKAQVSNEDEEEEEEEEEEQQQKRLKGFYGPKWFKCPWINCLCYYQGFRTSEQRQHHLNKHDRPFLCYIPGCHMEVFGYATSSELRRHLLKYHGIDGFDETSDDEFPDPPKQQTATTSKSEATYSCLECGKKFTRNHNLKIHLRSHGGLKKPYTCDVCGKEFTRKFDRDRHEIVHGEKKFVCTGSLKNGELWGCGKAFGRLDKLADHFKTAKGRRCVRPQVEERMRDNGGDGGEKSTSLFDDQTGENADALRAAGKSLPAFHVFLQLCGLVSSTEDPKDEASSSGNVTASIKA
ncbi:hypothetical protein F5Y03DRAFT_324179 [Xylaria venustula]|nr:hypothetical protein F5Y03DRAFT_324179 [Xylaria venustula]